ncbi:hypothetical protein HK096_010079 [Nowakowskiella sp. JEL0078]|nr:hypothetical protein HK096_010079 [Nowakowskiella sp. JEL0078]
MSKWIGIPAPKSLNIQIVTGSSPNPLNFKATNNLSDSIRGSPSAGSPLTSITHFVGQCIVLCGRVQILNIHNHYSSIGFLGLELEFTGTLNLRKPKSSAIKENTLSTSNSNSEILFHRKLVLKDPACDEETFVSSYEPTYIPFEFNIDPEIAQNLLPSMNARVAKSDGGPSANVYLLTVEYNLQLKMVGIKRGKDVLEVKFPIVLHYCNRPDKKYLNDDQTMFKRSIAEDMHQAVRWWTVLPPCLFPDCGAEIRYQFHDLLDRHCTTSKRVKEMEFTLYECTTFGSISSGSMVCKDKRFTWTLSSESVQNEGWGKSARGTAPVPPLSGSFTPANYLKFDRGINPSGIWKHLSIYHEIVISVTLSTGSNKSNKSICGKIPIHVSGVSRQAYLETSWAIFVRSAENYHINPPMWAWETDKALRDSESLFIPLPQNSNQEPYEQQYISNDLVKHVLRTVTGEDRLPSPGINQPPNHLTTPQTQFNNPQTIGVTYDTFNHDVDIYEYQQYQPRSAKSLPRSPNLITNSQHNNFAEASTSQQSFNVPQKQQLLAQNREQPATSFNIALTLPEQNQSQGVSSSSNIQSSNLLQQDEFANNHPTLPSEVIKNLHQGLSASNSQKTKYQATNDDIFWYDLMENVHRQSNGNPLVSMNNFNAMNNIQSDSDTHVASPYMWGANEYNMQYHYPQRAVTMTHTPNNNASSSAIENWQHDVSTSAASEQRKLGLSDEELVELAIQESLTLAEQRSPSVVSSIQRSETSIVVPSSIFISPIETLQSKSSNANHTSLPNEIIKPDILTKQAKSIPGSLIHEDSIKILKYNILPISRNASSSSNQPNYQQINSYRSNVSVEQQNLGLSEQELIDLAIQESLSINNFNLSTFETNSKAGPSRIEPLHSLSSDREPINGHQEIRNRENSTVLPTSAQRDRPQSSLEATKDDDVDNMIKIVVAENSLVSPSVVKFAFPSVDEVVQEIERNVTTSKLVLTDKIPEFPELEPLDPKKNTAEVKI